MNHETVYSSKEGYATTANPMLEIPRAKKESISRAKKNTDDELRGRPTESVKNKGLSSQVSSRASSMAFSVFS